jgi:hypothetical protein
MSNILKIERNSPMKKSLIIASILLIVGILAACTGRQAYGNGNRTTGQAGDSNQSAPANGSSGSSELSLESVVGIGILKLEGSDKAIDATKAAELLPLFKALKTLSTNNNTAIAEMTALNRQIKNTLTSDQLTAIQNLKITSADINALMQANGLGGTRSASNSSSSSSSGGGFGGPGGPPDAAMMAVVSGQSSSRSSSTVATPNAAAALATARKSAGGYNLTFVDPIIKLLESKTGVAATSVKSATQVATASTVKATVEATVETSAIVATTTPTPAK